MPSNYLLLPPRDEAEVREARLRKAMWKLRQDMERLGKPESEIQAELQAMLSAHDIAEMVDNFLRQSK